MDAPQRAKDRGRNALSSVLLTAADRKPP